MSEIRKMFFYGTLKKLKDTESFAHQPISVEPAQLRGYTMLNAGSFPVIRTGSATDIVHGVLYDFSKLHTETFNKLLCRLDMYEGVWNNLYKRIVENDFYVYVEGDPKFFTHATPIPATITKENGFEYQNFTW